MPLLQVLKWNDRYRAAFSSTITPPPGRDMQLLGCGGGRHLHRFERWGGGGGQGSRGFGGLMQLLQV